LGRPSGVDLRSEYLLSGLAQCSLCGGSLVCQKRGTAKHTYMCIYHHKRGPSVCPNALHIRMTTLDAAVLDAIRATLDERLLGEAVRRAVAELRADHAKRPDERRALEQQLAVVDARLRHLVEAIARVGPPSPSMRSYRRKRRRSRSSRSVWPGLSTSRGWPPWTPLGSSGPWWNG
jgi:hypothetical protein